MSSTPAYQQLKKIVYVPGIISLCIIPILFSYYSERHLASSLCTSIRLVVPAIHRPGEIPQSFSEEDFPVQRSYTAIRFTGDLPTDQLKLAFAQVLTREILSKKDSVNGVHFVFDSLSQYETFVQALDMLNVENANTYVPLRNNLWFCYLPPGPKAAHSDLKLIGCYVTTEIKTHQRKTPFSEKLGVAWRSAVELIASFIFFLFFVILLRRRQCQRGKKRFYPVKNTR